jgi:hypothetical protein
MKKTSFWQSLFPTPDWKGYRADVAKAKELNLREACLGKAVDRGLSGEEALADADKQYDLIQELRARHGRS